MSPLVLRLCLAGVFEHPALVLVVLGTLGKLVAQLAHPNVWHRRMAQRVLNDRRDNTVMGLLQKQFATGATAWCWPPRLRHRSVPARKIADYRPFISCANSIAAWLDCRPT